MKLTGLQIANSLSGPPIRFGRVEQSRAPVGRKADFAVYRYDPPIEAGTSAGVASCIVTGHVYAEQNYVLVTICEDFGDVLEVP